MCYLCELNDIYFIESGEINVYPKCIKMVFSQVKEDDIFTSGCYFYYLFRITSVVSIVSLTDAVPTSFFELF